MHGFREQEIHDEGTLAAGEGIPLMRSVASLDLVTAELLSLRIPAALCSIPCRRASSGRVAQRYSSGMLLWLPTTLVSSLCHILLQAVWNVIVAGCLSELVQV